jgi:hypothetical protein
MRGLVYAKLIVFIVSAVAMCAWTLTKAGGIGEVARQPGTAHGSELRIVQLLLPMLRIFNGTPPGLMMCY